MRKKSKRSVTSEFVFESDDGTSFPYEGLAVEHDIELLEEQISDLKKGEINIPEFNLVGNIYKAETEKELSLLEKYCEAKDLTLNEDSIPALIIITDSLAVSVNKMKELSSNIGGL